MVCLVILFIQLKNDNNESAETIPIVGSEESVFSLDAKVLGESRIDLDIIYLLEYRGSPNYRILGYNPRNQTLEEVFNIPRGSLVYSIELNPQKDTLAIAYTDNYSQEGSGLYLLDLQAKQSQLQEIVPETGSYYLDLEWSNEDVILATQTSGGKGNIVSIDAKNGGVELLTEDAIDPASTEEGYAFLALEKDSSRRSVGVYDFSSKTVKYLDILNKKYDLDNITVDKKSGDLLVAALSRGNDVTRGFGISIHAHGNHSIPSSWLKVRDGDSQDINLESTLVYDAKSLPDGSLLEVTNEGLFVSNLSKERVHLIKSRAFRYLTY